MRQKYNLISNDSQKSMSVFISLKKQNNTIKIYQREIKNMHGSENVKFDI